MHFEERSVSVRWNVELWACVCRWGKGVISLNSFMFCESSILVVSEGYLVCDSKEVGIKGHVGGTCNGKKSRNIFVFLTWTISAKIYAFLEVVIFQAVFAKSGKKTKSNISFFKWTFFFSHNDRDIFFFSNSHTIQLYNPFHQALFSSPSFDSSFDLVRALPTSIQF